MENPYSSTCWVRVSYPTEPITHPANFDIDDNFDVGKAALSAKLEQHFSERSSPVIIGDPYSARYDSGVTLGTVCGFLAVILLATLIALGFACWRINAMEFKINQIQHDVDAVYDGVKATYEWTKDVREHQK